MPQKLSCFCLFFVLLLFPPEFLKMGVESSTSSKVLLRLVISVLTIISLEDWVASESVKDAHCEAGKCGDVIKDCYFWSDTKPCPDFQSECHETLVFNLQPFGEYVVDYDNQTLGSSSEFERTGNACFAPIKHSPKPPSFLKSDERPSYLAFLHYCSSFPNVDYLNPHSTSPSGGANRSYVALIVDIPENLHLNLSVCQSHVIVPVELDRKDRDKPENVNSADTLKDGIRLKWNLTSWESCVKCKESGGKCWEPDGSFQCLCSGKAYPRTCKKGNTFRLIPCNSNSLNSPMCFSVNFIAMLSKLDKDFKVRGRSFWLPLIFYSQFLFPTLASFTKPLLSYLYSFWTILLWF